MDFLIELWTRLRPGLAIILVAGAGSFLAIGIIILSVKIMTSSFTSKVVTRITTSTKHLFKKAGKKIKDDKLVPKQPTHLETSNDMYDKDVEILTEKGNARWNL
jgi:hypothetical protein